LPKNTPAAEPEQALAVTQNPTALALVQQILGHIAQADEDPTPRMQDFIFNHPPEEWEGLFAKLDSVKDHVNDRFIVHDMRARESDFEGPLGVYLILDVTDLQTGEKGLLSCSSQMSMVQLLALKRQDRLPATVQIIEKDKPTKAGFKPIHLRYISPGAAPLGDPGAVVSEQ
jgi:hypothetical protein